MNQSFVTANGGDRSPLDTDTEEQAREDDDRSAWVDFDAWLAASPDREPDAGDELL